MKKLISLLNSGLLGLFSILLVALLLFSCAKSEVAVGDDTIGASSGDEQAEEPDDYISPDNFNLIEMDFGANADAEEAGNQNAPQNASETSTKSAGTGLTFSLIEDSLDDEEESTRTALNETTGSITWNEGDGLKVYYYQGKKNYTEATIKHGGEASSTLTARVNDSDKYYYAFYPYDGFETDVTYEGDATYTYGAITVTIPSTQTVTLTEGTTNNFASCHMAVGKASKEEQQFVFSNVGSYMKIEVTNTTATAITLQSSNGENIVGTFTVPFTNDAGTIGTPVVDSGSSSVRVILPKRSGAITVYVPLLPNVSVQGFRIRYEYDDGEVHPGYANAKLEDGVRVTRTFARRHVLNVGDLDPRIRENYYVKTDGTCSDVDVKGAGNAWGNALNLTGLVDLLSQKVDADGDQITLDDHDRAWMLDGSTIHLASGTYNLPATTNKEGFKVEFTGYGSQVNITLDGSADVAVKSTADSTATIFTPANAASTYNCALVFGNQTNISINNIEFTGARPAHNQNAALKVAAGGSGNATVHVSSCLFDYNEDVEGGTGEIHAASACAIMKGSGDFSKCTFKENTARWGPFSMGNVTDGGNVTLTQCKFEDNYATNIGGAVSLFGEGRTTTMNDCYFYGNHTGNRGGAIQQQAGSLILNICKFRNNYASYSTNGGNNFKYGGGVICMMKSDSTTPYATLHNLEAYNCWFKDNYCESTVTPTTSGFQRFGGVLLVDDSIQTTNVFFDGCTFDGNSSTRRGGVMFIGNNSFLKMINCKIMNNQTESGGMIYCHDNAVAYLSRVAFWNNNTTATGNSWATCIHIGTSSIVCLNNVTTYHNLNGGPDGDTHYAINGDGKFLITDCTLIEDDVNGLVRMGGGDKSITVLHNNVLINQYSGRSKHIVHVGSGASINDQGNNVMSTDGAAESGNYPAYSSDVHNTFSKTDLLGSFSDGVYSWDRATADVSKANFVEMYTDTHAPVFETMQGQFNYASETPSISNVGNDFYNWMVENGEAVLDCRGKTRHYGASGIKYTWYPGAYDGNVN